MTIQQFKICFVVVHSRRLSDVLAAFPQFDYIGLEDALPPRFLDFSDCRFDDSTVVTLSPLGQAAYDHVRLKAMAVSIPILLSAVGVIVAILKP